MEGRQSTDTSEIGRPERRESELGRVRVDADSRKPDRIIQACGGVVVRSEPASSYPSSISVLMIFRNGFWDLPKGKLEPGESRKECAVREVSEEIGYTPGGGWNPGLFLGVTDHRYELKGEWIEKWTSWWVFGWGDVGSVGGEKNSGCTGSTGSMGIANAPFRPQTEEGITKVEWVNLPRAIEVAGFENLRLVLRRLEAGEGS